MLEKAAQVVYTCLLYTSTASETETETASETETETASETETETASETETESESESETETESEIDGYLYLSLIHIWNFHHPEKFYRLFQSFFHGNAFVDHQGFTYLFSNGHGGV